MRSSAKNKPPRCLRENLRFAFNTVFFPLFWEKRFYDSCMYICGNYPQKKMRKNVEVLEALFRYATEGIIVSVRNGTIVMANPTAERQFGYAPGGLEGKTIEDLVPRRVMANHAKYREGYIKMPHPRSMGQGLDLFAHRADGSEFPVEISLSYFKAGDMEYVMSFVIDITERKKQDEYIRNMNRELEERVSERTQALAKANRDLAFSKQELTGALEKEKQLNELKSRFVTTASHEFRTPLAAILSSVSLIDRYDKNEDLEKRQKHIKRIKSMVGNLTEILNDFLSLGKLEEGVVRNNPEPMELLRFLAGIVDEMKDILKPGQQVQFTCAETDLPVHLDGFLLRNVVINLLSNAVKYSSEGKAIRLEVERLPTGLRLRVKDQGIGIPEEDRPHVFERFYRARNSTNIQGTGLGLDITKRYVQLMGGEITLHSSLDDGTTFEVTLPG